MATIGPRYVLFNTASTMLLTRIVEIYNANYKRRWERYSLVLSVSTWNHLQKKSSDAILSIDDRFILPSCNNSLYCYTLGSIVMFLIKESAGLQRADHLIQLESPLIRVWNRSSKGSSIIPARYFFFYAPYWRRLKVNEITTRWQKCGGAHSGRENDCLVEKY